MNKRTEKKSARITDEKIIELYWQRNEDAIKVTDTEKRGKSIGCRNGKSDGTLTTGILPFSISSKLIDL